MNTFRPDRRGPLNAERLRQVLDYNASTGVFTRRLRVGQTTRVGDVAGTDNRAGYLQCRIDGRLYKCHRLAWLHVHDHWPLADIDHLNGIGTDNRIANLRDVPEFVNCENRRRAQKSSESGLIGANKTRNGKFQALIDVRGKRIHLGRFDTAQEAHEAYVAAKRKFHVGCTI